MITTKKACSNCKHFCFERSAGGLKEETGICLNAEAEKPSNIWDRENWQIIQASSLCDKYQSVNKEGVNV